MRASLPLPDLDAKLTPAEASRLKREFMTHTCNVQGEWMDMVMRKLLPRKLYRMAHDESPPWEQFEARQAAVKEWLDRNDIRIIQQGMRQHLYMGRERLSTFLVRLAEK